MNIKTICTGLMLVASSLFAKNSMVGEGTKLDATLDSDGNIHPDILLPISWSKNLSSGIEYRTSKTVETSKVSGFTDSSKETTLEHKVLNINILNYTYSKELSSYSLGIGATREIFNKTQPGYATVSSTRVNFDNSVDITIQGAGIRGEAVSKKFINRYLSGKIGFLLSPASTLTVEQDTSIQTPTILSSGSCKTTAALDPIYEINGGLILKTDFFIDFGIEGRYQHLPMKYNLSMVDSNLQFKKQEFDIVENISFYAAKIYLDMPIFGNLLPTLGYSSESTNGKENNSGDTYSKTETKYIFGLDSQF